MSWRSLNPANEPYVVSVDGIGGGVGAKRIHWFRHAWTGAESSTTTAICIHNTITMTTATQTILGSACTQPTTPRCLSVTGAATQTGVVTIYGTDINDHAISESFTMDPGVKVLGAKAFKSVTSVVVPPYTTADTKTLTIGDSTLLGLPLILPDAASIFAHYDAGVLEDAAPTITVDAADISKNTMIAHTPAHDHAVVVIGYIYA